MDFEKKSHLSGRSKRRRIQEELQNDNGAIFMGDLNNGPVTSKNSKYFQTNINICSNQSVFMQLNETIDKSPPNLIPQEIDNLDLIFELLDKKSSILTSSSSETEESEDNCIDETTLCDQSFLFHNSVEVVPSNWFEKDLCAWPKKNLRSCIDNQISPNEKCFRYLNARKLGKDINSYKIAEEKANRAKLTSDLSTNDSSQENVDRYKPKLKRKVSLDKKTKHSLWSPNSDDIFDDSDADPLYSPELNNAQELVIGKLSSPKLHSSSSLPVLARKKLDFDICSSSDQNQMTKQKTDGNSVSPKPFSSDYQSISFYSDPRKKICLSASPSTPKKIQQFKNADKSRATSKFDNIKHATIISTSSSPFKVTHDESCKASTSQTTQNKQMNNNSGMFTYMFI
ncbi:hypothetical protein ACI65C_001400 [Semiaphis heraclei]